MIAVRTSEETAAINHRYETVAGAEELFVVACLFARAEGWEPSGREPFFLLRVDLVICSMLQDSSTLVS
jgi:hypothetical protein